MEKYIMDHKNHAERLQIDALTENMDKVRAFIESYLEKTDCPPDVMMKIDLAVEELFVNVAYYAYGDDSGMAAILIEVPENERKVTVTVEDGGIRFDPFDKPEVKTASSAKDQPIGGLGIHIVKKMMDKVSYEFKENRNIVTIEKAW